MRQTSERKAADVDGIAISLTIDGKLSLFILLAEEGLINRMGTGSLIENEEELCIGRGDPSIFRQVRAQLTEGMLRALGREYEFGEIRGASCKLEIVFQFKDKTSDGLALLYGSESQGPPKDARDIVTAAVFLTETWYQEFRKTAAKSGRISGTPANRTNDNPRPSVLDRLRNCLRAGWR